MRKRGTVAISASAAASPSDFDGYRREPETAAEVRVATAAAMSALTSEPWDLEG